MADQNDPWAQLDAIAGPETNTAAASSQPLPQPKAVEMDAWAQLDQIAPPDAVQGQEQPAAPQNAPTQGMPSQAPQERMDATNLTYASGSREGIKIPTSGTVSVPDPVHGAAAAKLVKLVGDHRNTDEAIIAFAKANDVMTPSLLTVLDWRRKHPDYRGTYSAQGFDHTERPMTTAEWLQNNAVSTPEGTALLNGAIAYGDLGNGLTGGLPEHLIGNEELNRAKIAAINANNPGAALVGQIGGGIVGGAAIEKAAVESAARLGEGAAAKVVQTATPYVANIATGAAQGAGAAEDGNRGNGAILGATLGGAGTLASKGLATLKPTASAVSGREVLDAAGRLSRDGVTIKPIPADVGGSFARGTTAIADQGFVSGVITRAAKDKNVEGLAAAASRVTDGMVPGTGTTGSLADAANEVATAPGGIASIPDRARSAADAAYKQAEALAGPARVQVPKTVAALDAQIAKLEAVPGGVAGLDKLKALRADLVKGDHTIAGLRQLRTSFGDQFDVANRTARDAAKALWGPLTDDISGGLAAAGKGDAAAAYRAADTAYATAKSQIRDVVNPLVGKNLDASVEQISSRLHNLARTDGKSLADTLAAMSPDIAGKTRAAMLRDLGGETFTPNTFASKWSKLSEDGKEALAPTGTQARQDINDIVRVAEANKQAGKMGNHSNTGRALHGFRALGHLVSGAAGWTTLGKSLIAEGALGAALSSNKLARFGVTMGESRPLAKAGLKGLSALKRQSPAIQGLSKTPEDNTADQ